MTSLRQTLLACLLPVLLSSPAKGTDDSSNDATPTNHWSYHPLRPVDPPAGGHPIDAFIRERLAARDLEPNPPADRVTLIRRLTFGLHGLPPTPEQIDAFVRDPSPDDDAVAALIDRLLASPRYGERWARHWLDVARYSESQGFERDKMRPNAWRYRDYVIDSLNDDKPYDVFAREQIAGDVLEPVTGEGIVATGFLVAGPWDEVGNGQQSSIMRSRVREEELEDMISAVGQTFLGVTINCARCHAHKFDPVPQEDYYRFKAVFEGVRHGDRTVLTADEIAANEARIASLAGPIAEVHGKVSALEATAFATISDAPHPAMRSSFEDEDGDERFLAERRGGAELKDGRLVVNGASAYAATPPYPGALREKTLEAWVIPGAQDVVGGGVIAIESLDRGVGDAIVFGWGKNRANKWVVMESDGKTRNFGGPEEAVGAGEPVHVAAVFRGDGSIAFYRNGEPYGTPYVPDSPRAPREYEASGARLLAGKRPSGPGSPWFQGAIEEARLYDRALGEAEIARSFRAGYETPGPEEIRDAMTKTQHSKYKRLHAKLDELHAKVASAAARPETYAAKPKKPEPTHFLARGDILLKKQVMKAGGLSAVTAPSPDFGIEADAPEAERRRRFAAWMTRADNPLFARTIVNRAWHCHFGAGIVDTPNDLGVSGSRPTHPELLDWLAAEFIRQGWSLKKLHALILTSATWRQSSSINPAARAVDADNRLLWRFAPKRLEAEALRDSMLAVSGNLNLEMGGPSVRPFKLKIRNTHFYTFEDRSEPEFNRRTIYRAGVQSLRDSLLDTLDCPDKATKTPVRGVTVTPVQALALMNNEFVIRQSRDLAARLGREHPGDLEAQVALAHRLTLGRAPTAAESARMVKAARESGLDQACWVLLNTTEFIFVQ